MGESPHPPLPVRSWRRFSLRAAFVAVTLLCLFFVYLGRVERQRRIVDQFEAWGFKAIYVDRFASTWATAREFLFGKSPQAEDDPFAPSPPRPAPNNYVREVVRLLDTRDETLQEPLPPDFSLRELPQLSALRELHLHRVGLTPAEARRIAQCPRLQELTLTFAQDDEAVLAEVGHLPKLTHLRLSGNVTDAGLRQLVGLTRLKSISLWNPQITDKGLAELAQLQTLTTVAIRDAQHLNGVGLQALSQLPRLHSLVLSKSPLSDDCLAVLVNFPALRFILLDDCPIGDEGVRQLVRCRTLTTISLCNTRISDASMPLFAELPQLEALRLYGCKITNQPLRPNAHWPALPYVFADEQRPPADQVAAPEADHTKEAPDDR